MPQFEPFTTVYKLKFLSEYRHVHCFRTCLQFLDFPDLHCFRTCLQCLNFPDFYCSRMEKLMDKMVH